VTLIYGCLRVHEPIKTELSLHFYFYMPCSLLITAWLSQIINHFYNYHMDKMDNIGVSLWGAFFGILASYAVFGMDKPYSAMFFAGGGAVLGYIFVEATD